MMVRNKYRLNSNSLYYMLLLYRLNNSPFRPEVSAREANLAWEKRRQTNNKHTAGTEA